MKRSTNQILVLYASTLLGTLLGLVSSIVNTRFLDPVAYGDVRYVQNILCFVSSLLLLGYFLSGSRLLALSDDEDNSRKIRGCMVVILGITGLIMILVTGGCAVIHVKQPNIARLFCVSLPVCLYPLLLNYINTTAQGDNHIGRLSIARLCPNLVYVFIAYLIYNQYGTTSSQLILLQWGVYTLVLSLLLISTRPSFKDIGITYKILNKENKNYGFQLYIGSLVMVASNYLAGISLSMFNMDNTEVGFYTLALTVTGPLATLSSIIGTAKFKSFAKQSKIPNDVLFVNIMIALCSCALFIVFIKHVVVLLYSEKYAPVGDYASWLAVGFSIHGFGDMINRYLGSHGRGRDIRNASIANGVIKILGYTLFVYLWNTPGAIFTTILCDVIYMSMMLYYYITFVKVQKDNHYMV